MHLRVMIIYVVMALLAFYGGLGQNQCCRKLQRDMRRKIDKQYKLKGIKYCHNKTCRRRRSRIAGTCGRKHECPFGFILFKGVCYWFIMGPNNIPDWWSAKNHCKNHSGNLVTVNEGRREKFIRDHMEANFLNSGTEIKINTGLIFTDTNAWYPFVQISSNEKPSSPVGDGVRWTSTRELIKWNENVTVPTLKLAKWSPNIEGFYDGPNHSYLSCVVIIWNPLNSSALTWRFNLCTEKSLNLICEVRLRPHKSLLPLKRRNKRSPSSSHQDIFLGINNIEDEEDIYENKEEIYDNEDDDDDDEL